MSEAQTGAPQRTDGEAPANGQALAPGAPPPPEKPASEEKQEKPRRRLPPAARTALIVVGVIVAILILFWLVRTIAYAMAHQSTDDAKVDADTVTVTSKINEHVSRIYVDTNQPVTQGQLLVQLDDRDERTRYQQALESVQAQEATAGAARENVRLTQATVQAQTQQGRGGITSAQSGISNAQLQVAVAQQGVDQARAQLSDAQASVPAAQAALDRATADFRRTQALVGSGDVAKANLDAARATLEAARAQYQAAQDNVAAARAGVDSAVSRVAAAQASVNTQQGQLVTAQGRLQESNSPYRVAAQQAQAAAAQAQVGSLQAQLRGAADQLSYTKIYAPISGYVGLKSVDIGQQVSPGMALLTIVPLNKVYVTANFKETQMGSIRPGQQVDISVDAYKGVRFSGHVATIAPASQNTFALVPAQNASGNFVKVTQRIPVRIYVDSASVPLQNAPLRPGMSVVASVKVK